MAEVMTLTVQRPAAQAPALPFLIRGTAEWDARERERLSLGNKCISLGRIRPGEITRSVSIAKARSMPSLERAALLRARHEARLDGDSSEGRSQRALASAR